MKADIFHGSEKVCLVSKPSFNQVFPFTSILPQHVFSTLLLKTFFCKQWLHFTTTCELCVSVPILSTVSKLNDTNKNSSWSAVFSMCHLLTLCGEPDAVQVSQSRACQLGQSVGLSGRKWLGGAASWSVCALFFFFFFLSFFFYFALLRLDLWKETTAESMSQGEERHAALVQQEFMCSQSFLKFLSCRPGHFLFPSCWPWSS